jgi:predicted kinase
MTQDARRSAEDIASKCHSAYVHAGFHTIIEIYVVDEWARATLAEVFADVSVATIVLVCERATVEQRTRERGDRLLDYALAH